MTFEKAKREIIRCGGKGIRRACWNDKTLRITEGKQPAGARNVPKDKETIHDDSRLFYQTDKTDCSDGGVYNGTPLKVGLGGEVLVGKKIIRQRIGKFICR